MHPSGPSIASGRTIITKGAVGLQDHNDPTSAPIFTPAHDNLSLGPRGFSDNFHPQTRFRNTGNMPVPEQDPGYRPLALGKARWGTAEYFGECLHVERPRDDRTVLGAGEGREAKPPQLENGKGALSYLSEPSEHLFLAKAYGASSLDLFVAARCCPGPPCSVSVCL